MTKSLIHLVTLFLSTLLSLTTAFSTHGAFNAHRSKVSPLQMVFGPKQALSIEKRKDPQKYEATIAGLMKTKKLTRKAAEDVSTDHVIFHSSSTNNLEFTFSHGNT